MRTRLLAAVAVFAAALLVPAAALAAPVLVTPSSPIVTNDGVTPIDFTWTDDGASLQFQIVSADPSGGVCPGLPGSNKQPVSGIILSTDPFDYPFTPSVNATSCYYVEGYDGVALTESAPVLITYDTAPPTGAITSPAIVHATAGALTDAASDAGSGVASVAFERSADGNPPWTAISTDTTFPYSANWDTTDGVYFVHAIITDALGNPSFTTPDVSLRIDTTAPVVT